jgi:hypothetical protein
MFFYILIWLPFVSISAYSSRLNMRGLTELVSWGQLLATLLIIFFLFAAPINTVDFSNSKKDDIRVYTVWDQLFMTTRTPSLKSFMEGQNWFLNQFCPLRSLPASYLCRQKPVQTSHHLRSAVFDFNLCSVWTSIGAANTATP